MCTRTVLVISDANYFSNYVWERRKEFAKEHSDVKVRSRVGNVVLSCDAFIHEKLNSWDTCDTLVSYIRIASVQALRGLVGPVEVVRQGGYSPRGAKSEDVSEMIKLINTKLNKNTCQDSSLLAWGQHLLEQAGKSN